MKEQDVTKPLKLNNKLPSTDTSLLLIHGGLHVLEAVSDNHRLRKTLQGAAEQSLRDILAPDCLADVLVVQCDSNGEKAVHIEAGRNILGRWHNGSHLFGTTRLLKNGKTVLEAVRAGNAVVDAGEFLAGALDGGDDVVDDRRAAVVEDGVGANVLAVGVVVLACCGDDGDTTGDGELDGRGADTAAAAPDEDSFAGVRGREGREWEGEEVWLV